MEAPQTLHATSYLTTQDYLKEGNKFISGTLMQELKKFSISAEELNSSETVLKYQIGKHTFSTPTEIHEIYSALGITLVEATWLLDKLIVSTPKASINYAESHRYIREQLDLDLQSYRYQNPATTKDDLDPA